MLPESHTVDEVAAKGMIAPAIMNIERTAARCNTPGDFAKQNHIAIGDKYLFSYGKPENCVAIISGRPLGSPLRAPM